LSSSTLPQDTTYCMHTSNTKWSVTSTLHRNNPNSIIQTERGSTSSGTEGNIVSCPLINKHNLPPNRVEGSLSKFPLKSHLRSQAIWASSSRASNYNRLRLFLSTEKEWGNVNNSTVEIRIGMIFSTESRSFVGTFTVAISVVE
jgi:hypothetical protein